MTETLLTSASQIKLYRECKRKFGWSYLAKIKSPPNAAAQLGIEVDDTQLQPYLRDGRPFDYTRESGYIAAAGLAYLPQPKSPGLEVQKHFVMPSPSGGFGYQGYIDLWLPKGGMPDLTCDEHTDCQEHQDLGAACAASRPIVCDFKTTSNFRYALTPETLATDVQGQLYAMHTLVETKAPSVELVWLYFATRGPRKVKRVHLRVTKDHAAEQFERINDTAAESFNVRKAHAASGLSAEDFILNELEPNASMCDAYGGCPYRSKCNLSPAQITKSLDDNLKRTLSRLTPLEDLPMSSTIDLLASLKARKPAEAMPQAPEPAPIKAPLPINPPESVLPPAPFHPPAMLQEPAVEVAKAKRGRPKKDPLGADVAAHTAIAVPVPSEQASDPFEAAIEKQIGADFDRHAKIGALVSELFELLGGSK